jgi:hypothetical protein
LHTKGWSVDDLVKVMIVVTTCLCILILVVGVTIAVVLQKLDAQILGSVQGVGIGSGLLGILWILYRILSHATPRALAVARAADDK